MSIENPELGEIRRGHEIKPLSNDLKFYKWASCIDCGEPGWKALTYGEIRTPRCRICGHKLMVRNRLAQPNGYRGRTDVGTKQISHIPKLGEIRHSDEIGKGHGQKFIYHACEICGKQRWVALIVSTNEPFYKRCNTCSKNGSVRFKSFAEVRQCSKCGVEYPATDQYFYHAQRSYRGISRTCKKCRNKQVVLNAKLLFKKIQYRLHRNISESIRKSLKGIQKNNRWEILVGYSKYELMQHLEKQFRDGMSWDNYGLDGWVIDHITPKTAFCFKQPTDIDFKRCWSLSNLQPLWYKRNCEKGNRMDRPFQPYLPITIEDSI